MLHLLCRWQEQKQESFLAPHWALVHLDLYGCGHFGQDKASLILTLPTVHTSFATCEAQLQLGYPPHSGLQLPDAKGLSLSPCSHLTDISSPTAAHFAVLVNCGLGLYTNSAKRWGRAQSPTRQARQIPWPKPEEHETAQERTGIPHRRCVTLEAPSYLLGSGADRCNCLAECASIERHLAPDASRMRAQYGVSSLAAELTAG